ncbi:MAG: ABC transporter permease [Clostridiaceae bacterium]|jgi:peptide/nickel transport system permease protein|nr:ABC transporter permease [Clostridiaceae bacterium]
MSDEINKNLSAEQLDSLAEIEETAGIPAGVPAPLYTDGARAEAEEEKIREERGFEVPADGDDTVYEAKEISPIRMVIKRFFRSKLSVIGLVLIIALFLFSFLGPVVYSRWGETEVDESPGRVIATSVLRSYQGPDGKIYEVYEVKLDQYQNNKYAYPDKDHLLGTDDKGMDIFSRLMYGGRISLMLGFIVVFMTTIIGVALGGLAGYFGKRVDQIIMRVIDVFNCIPGLPIMLIFGVLLSAWDVPLQLRIYCLMGMMTLFGWAGTARMVRGLILSLREQDYMVAAEAMGFSAGRKIFKHLIPNVMPQLIVAMTLSLGGVILQEAALSWLGIGVPMPYAAWGTMISMTNDSNILANYFNMWGPPGILIILAVLAFNFVGDGLRDAMDPRMKR